MYPILFRIGEFEITSFGMMVAVAALAGVEIFRHELRQRGLPEDAVQAAIYGVIGGLVGAKLLWVAEHAGQEPLTGLIFSRGGLSWFGGFLGGVGTGLMTMRVRGWPVVPVLAAATPALAFGHLLGRIGCFLVGDDYGRPTGLPWGIAFPEGLPPTDVPVHPTQLYEALFLGCLGWMLLRWRRQVSDGQLIGRYLLLAGTARFLIEFIRINERVALGLTVAHWVSLAMMMAGGVLIARRQPKIPVVRVSPDPVPRRR
jgi:phosphatidylglycerol:prolipoprotein diacylglycerol transferase